jgi:IMP dehydrogenase
MTAKIKYYQEDKALAFPDVYLIPSYSDILSRFGKQVDISTKVALGAPKINIPIISAGMDTVTEDQMAVEMALNGGLGEIHRNNTPEKQAQLVRLVKEKMRLMEKKPPMLPEMSTIGDAQNLLEKRKRGYVLTYKGNNFKGKISGIVTSKDFLAGDTDTKLKDVSSSFRSKDNQMVRAIGDIGFDEAVKTMKKERVEKLPIFDKDDMFLGIYTLRDYMSLNEHPQASLDKQGRLMVGAAIGVHDIDVERTLQVVEAGADILFIDIAHGHSVYSEKMIKRLKIKEKIKTPIVVGNVATKEGVLFAYEIGADGIKVGIGPGFVCKTRNVAGTGIPQITAILEAKKALKGKKNAPPIMADGGVREPGDIAKAIVSGADSVMLGTTLSGTDKSPGDLVKIDGVLHKHVRGMASKRVLEDRKKISESTTNRKAYAPEGRETFVPFQGSTCDLLLEYTGGLRSAMSYVGAHSVKEMQEAKLIHISQNGSREQQRSLGS